MKIKSVLHVDDDAIIGRIVRLVLEHMENWRVDYASSCEDALDLLARTRPDLILLDIMMPNTDGLTTFNQMQRLGLIEGIPVILVSAKVLNDQCEYYRSLGFAGVIQKPFDTANLCDEIQLLADEFTGGRLAGNGPDGTGFGAQPVCVSGYAWRDT
jgi:CheY-like chemotaxis protein